MFRKGASFRSIICTQIALLLATVIICPKITLKKIKEIGLEHETANLLTGCNLLKTGIFKFKTNPFVTEKLPEVWKSIKIIDKGCYRTYDKALKKLLHPILKKNTTDTAILL